MPHWMLSGRFPNKTRPGGSVRSKERPALSGAQSVFRFYSWASQRHGDTSNLLNLAWKEDCSGLQA